MKRLIGMVVFIVFIVVWVRVSEWIHTGKGREYR